MEQNSNTHLILVGLLMIIIINLFILDLKIFAPISPVQLSDISTVSNTSLTPPISPISSNLSNLSCPASCLSAIQQATTSAGLGNLQQSRALQMAGGQSKETYIPLGTGSTTKSSWEDITATETVVYPGNYGNITEAYFIASLRNPTQNGQVEAQLYNVTDKHPVWGSHVILNGPKEQTITSGKITLDAGAKLYRVQLKSSLQYLVFLDNAKVRIIYE